MKKINLTGCRFGRLTVISEAERNKKNKKMWTCKCDCGNEKIILQQSLSSGLTKSCGCLKKELLKNRMSQGFETIFTKKFLEEEHIKNEKSLRKIAKEHGCCVDCVRSYMKKHKVKTNSRFYNISGKKFGRLTATSLAYTKNRCSYWNVKCDCGSTKVIKGQSLVNCQTKSCGCLAWKGYGDISKTYWSRLISCAKKRNHSFNVTIEHAWDIFLKQEGKCALSGREIVMDRHLSANYTKKDSQQTASLDRIDSSLGYCVGNVQWIHARLNNLKGNFEETEFICWCQAVASHNANKKATGDSGLIINSANS